jgi:hypothetical protein
VLQNGQYPLPQAQDVSRSIRKWHSECLVSRTDYDSPGQSSNVGRLAMHMVGNRASQTLQHRCCASGLVARKSTVRAAVQRTQECLSASPRCKRTPAQCNPAYEPGNIPERVLTAAVLLANSPGDSGLRTGAGEHHIYMIP